MKAFQISADLVIRILAPGQYEVVKHGIVIWRSAPPVKARAA